MTKKAESFANIYLVIAILVALAIGVILLVRSKAAGVDVKAQMLSAVPGTLGEDVPWGKQVNSGFPGYDWYDSAQNTNEMDLTGNGGAFTRINWWGAVFRSDSNNNNPSNTRVELANCSLWILFKNATAWEKLLGPELGGATFPPDYLHGSPGESEVTKTASGALVRPGDNGIYHFWWDGGFTSIDPSNIKAAMSNCMVRLVLQNPSGPDDRDQAGYIVHMGADWRIAGQENNCNPCPGLGVGKFYKVMKEWRNVTWQTLTAQEINSGTVLPPADAFGDAGGGTPAPTSSPTGNSTPTTNSQLTLYDIKPDRKIDIGDLGLLIKDYPKPGQTPVANSPADFNKNGRVDVSDLSKLVSNWGKSF